jgi:hypothetical protein
VGSFERLLRSGRVVDSRASSCRTSSRSDGLPGRCANSNMATSPFELPPASTGRRPVRLQMRIGF